MSRKKKYVPTVARELLPDIKWFEEINYGKYSEYTPKIRRNLLIVSIFSLIYKNFGLSLASDARILDNFKLSQPPGDYWISIIIGTFIIYNFCNYLLNLFADMKYYDWQHDNETFQEAIRVIGLYESQKNQIESFFKKSPLFSQINFDEEFSDLRMNSIRTLNEFLGKYNDRWASYQRIVKTKTWIEIGISIIVPIIAIVMLFVDMEYFK